MAPAPHALVIPYPAQGHVIPLLELAHALVDRGFTVTFANSEFNHDRVVAAMSKKDGGAELLDRVRLVAVPDGMAPGEDRNNLVRLTVLMTEHMAPRVEELIRRSGDAEGGPITCMVADYNLGTWALDVARRTGIKSVAIWPASAAVLATLLSIQKLIEDNIIDAEDGSALRQEGTLQLSPDMPAMNTAHLAWNCIGNHDGQEALFRYLVDGVRAVEKCDFVLCNSFHGAEQATFARFPKIVPVGPLLTGERRGKAVGHFWMPEDHACMSWLEAQPARSVVYVAFGSFTMFDRRQFQELALGLELSGRPFLWVVRPDIVRGDVHDYPDGFLDRISAGGRGMVVAWSPQQRVLAHPSVACFVSHCGWNSTMEGVRNGVPFLAWPYFADQFVNQVYICDVWKVGLRAVADEAGVITKEHIAGRVEELMADADMRERAEGMKKVAHGSVKEGGSSHDNFDMFVEALKA
ncbi:UDP-glycosyltransferase 83A1-like [Phragmites australis]|uniref:UDP-glycosyltransferase 83A1-like n=1 Tax=Phragmites australis TaxID=29695 RepID=UPI002D7A1294|nr:UDP-glycosyltransferase 83A1-like [Phragmites australis]